MDKTQLDNIIGNIATKYNATTLKSKCYNSNVVRSVSIDVRGVAVCSVDFLEDGVGVEGDISLTLDKGLLYIYENGVWVEYERDTPFNFFDISTCEIWIVKDSCLTVQTVRKLDSMVDDALLDVITCNIYTYTEDGWKLSCEVQGETGATGPTGMVGPIGPTGPTGYFSIEGISAINMIGITGGFVVDGQTGGIFERPIPVVGDEWIDPDSGERFIFNGSYWEQSKCCVRYLGNTGNVGRVGFGLERRFVEPITEPELKTCYMWCQEEGETYGEWCPMKQYISISFLTQQNILGNLGNNIYLETPDYIDINENICILKGPQQGTITPGILFGVSGTTYEPNLDHLGADTITFEATSIKGIKLCVTYNIFTILSVGEPQQLLPVARDDEFFVIDETTVLLDILANDFAQGGQTIDNNTIQIITSPISGMANIVGGQISYTPPVSQVGILDTFTYRVRDTLSVLTNPATVKVNIIPKLVLGDNLNIPQVRAENENCEDLNDFLLNGDDVRDDLVDGVNLYRLENDPRYSDMADFQSIYQSNHPSANSNSSLTITYAHPWFFGVGTLTLTASPFGLREYSEGNPALYADDILTTQTGLPTDFAINTIFKFKKNSATNQDVSDMEICIDMKDVERQNGSGLDDNGVVLFKFVITDSTGNTTNEIVVGNRLNLR